MGLINLVRNMWKYSSLDESIRSFAKKGTGSVSNKYLEQTGGEGYEYPGSQMSAVGLSSFNMFYNTYVNSAFKSEVDKIGTYRNIAQMPEIADVIEDAIIESTQEDLNGKILTIDIIDEDLRKNENIVKNIEIEFEHLFYNRIKIANIITDLFRTYYIDGRLFYERLINKAKPSEGILGIKKLPTETMDFEYDTKTLRITRVFQYLKDSAKRPSPEETEKDGVIIFHPEQIGFIDYGVYGKNRYDIIGYLDKSKIPYNQLKLLETSVIIYRIVRAPERLVFKIDVGQMPREKAIKYVEDQKNKMMKRPTYDPQSGALTNAPEIFCIKHDTIIPLLDGRKLALDDIIREFNSGKDNWVYSLNMKTYKVEPGKILKADITRKDEPLIRVWLDNGECIDTTYDHKFILRNGKDCRADKLKIDDSLMPFYTRMAKINKLDYEQVLHPGTQKWAFTHRVVSEHQNRVKEVNEVIHHVDFNRYNNSPTNLNLMDKQEHFLYHSSLLNDVWENNREERLLNMRAGWLTWLDTGNNRQIKSEETAYYNRKYNRAKVILEVLNGNPEMRARQQKAASENRKAYYAIEQNRINFAVKKTLIYDEVALQMLCDIFLSSGRPPRDKFLTILSNDKMFMSYLENLNKNQSISNRNFNQINKNILWKMIKDMGYVSYPDFRTNLVDYKIAVNHKVAKIEYLEEKADCGCITVEGNSNFAQVSGIFIKNSVQDNIFIPVSSEGGRGSDVTTVGGNPAGFAEMSDINYFQRKLYKALKYPMSRVTAMEQHQENSIMFSNSPIGEIARDEIKWATFLSRHQARFCDEMQKLFLLHLEFKGLKKQYELDDSKINIKLNPPSFFKEKQEQMLREVRFANYLALANQSEMSKSFLMERYMDFTEEEIQANADGLKKDVKYGFKEEPLDVGGNTVPVTDEESIPELEPKSKLKPAGKPKKDEDE